MYALTWTAPTAYFRTLDILTCNCCFRFAFLSYSFIALSIHAHYFSCTLIQGVITMAFVGHSEPMVTLSVTVNLLLLTLSFSKPILVCCDSILDLSSLLCCCSSCTVLFSSCTSCLCPASTRAAHNLASCLSSVSLSLSSESNYKNQHH